MMPFAFWVGLRHVLVRERNLLVAFLSRVSMLGLIVGVALLLLVLAIMNGFDRELRERILNLLPQASLYHRVSLNDWAAVKSVAEANPDVVAATPFVELHALVSVADKAEPIVVYGVDPLQESRVSGVQAFLQADLASLLSPEEPGVILGAALAKTLGVSLGDTVMLVVPDASGRAGAPNLLSLQVVALLTSHTEVDAHLALMHWERALPLTPTHTVTGVRLKLQDLFSARSTLWDLVTELGPGFYGTSWFSSHGNLYHAIQLSKSLVALLMSLIVGIAAFNVVSTLIMVVVEKRGAIAILRTLGASTTTIMAIFVVQGLVIGILGASLGVLLGLGLSQIAEPMLQGIEALFDLQFLQSDVYPLTYLPTQVLLPDVFRVWLTAVGLCFVATLYPAYRASQINPAEVLRYE
jgi:lipoprotein-releasing system permease protein